MFFKYSFWGKAGEYMELLEREEMYSGLKVFLSRECEEKNKKKKDLLDEREKLEVEKNKKRKILFQTDESGERRKMFSPLNTIFYPSQSENFQDRKIKNLNYRIKELSKQMELIEEEVEEIQTYLDRLEDFMGESTEKQEVLESQKAEESQEVLESQKAEESQEVLESQKGREYIKDEKILKKETAISKEDVIEADFVLAKTLENLREFIQKKYEKVEILYDIEDSEIEVGIAVNRYLVEVLQKIMEASINKMNADAFLVDVKDKEELRIEMEILTNKEKIDHCTFCVEF